MTNAEERLLDIITAWVQSKLRILEYAVLAAIIALVYYAGYHTRVILDEAADHQQEVRIVESSPKIITRTQTLLKVIHDSQSKCAATAIDSTILEQLHKSN